MTKVIISGCIILNQENEIYLLYRKKYQWYETPGGKADADELLLPDGLKKTALRELGEEVKGITKILSIEYLDSIDFVTPDGRECIAHKFLTRIEGRPEPAEDIFDKEKSGWIKLSELHTKSLSNSMKVFLPELINILKHGSPRKSVKKAYIIHGWGANPDMNWYPWLKKKLKRKGFVVEIPEMPDTDAPKIEEWVSKLSEIAEDNSVLIGHSIGCQTILRYLEKTDKKIKGVVLVAPWLKLKEETYEEEGAREIAKPWIDEPIEWENVKKNCENFVCIFSKNDPYVFSEDSVVFSEKLGAKIIIEDGQGHFDEDSGVKEIDVVFEETMKL